MKRYYIAGNWKMHKTIPEAVALATELKEQLVDCKEKLMIAPPFTALSSVAKVLQGSSIMLGAQNMGQQKVVPILAKFPC